MRLSSLAGVARVRRFGRVVVSYASRYMYRLPAIEAP